MPKRSPKSKPKVFVSHISAEAELAKILKRHISKDFLDMLEVFVSSDGVSIGAGDQWLGALEKALKGSSVEVVLCSKESVGRPWVNFEAGAAWLRQIPIVPVCHTDLKPESLPFPLSTLQAVEASQAAGLGRLYALLSKVLGVSTPRADFELIAGEIRACEAGYRKARRDGAAFERIERPAVFCAASEQYAEYGFAEDLEVVRKAFGDGVVPHEKLTARLLRDALTDNQFDLVHIVSFVDPKTGEIVLGERGQGADPAPARRDTLPPEGFAKLVEVTGARLVVLASCDSLVLGAKLARVTNMVAATDAVEAADIIDWEQCFYRMLSKGYPLSKAYEVATTTNTAPMLLMMKKDLAFAPES